MKEIWRIPTLDSLYGDYLKHQIWIEEIPNSIFLNISKEDLEKEETKSTIQIPDGFYEIDVETGKILWRINNPAPSGCDIDNGILYMFSPYNYDENIGYLAAIDLNKHSIRWAFNTKNNQLVTSNDEFPLIFSLRKNIEDGKLSDGPYIEFSSIDGSVAAYKNYYDLSESQYRYGYNYENKKMYKMKVQK
jgi:outer membrane protein assembly factor BamB